MKRLHFISLLLLLLSACVGTTVNGTSVAGPVITQSPPATVAGAPILPTLTPLVSTTLLAPSPSQTVPPASNLPDPGLYTWRLLVSGLNSPVGLTYAADGTGRLFVIERPGLIRIIQDGILSPSPFLDITDRVGSRSSEQGLLGLAFHPNYAFNGYFFVNYTDRGGDTIIARFQVSGSDTNRADPDSEQRLLKVSQPYPNHNGGMVAFGPDGYLYLGLGDGGSAGDPQGNGQSLSSLLGKILRIDVDHGDPYAVPGDNPFSAGGGKPEIWAYGLRNPWRFTFDRLTGDLYIADVGQNQWEEVNFLPAGSPGGANFGWNTLEGTHPFAAGSSQGFVNPVAEYDHGQGCSVTGGVVYRGLRLPSWNGVYLYGDYCSGNVWGLLRDPQGNWLNSLLFQSVGQIVSFDEDEAGDIYLVDYRGGIYVLDQVIPSGSLPPGATPTLAAIRFAVIGDYGEGNPAEQDVADLVKSWNPDFILTLGDNNYPSGAASTIDQNIGQFYHEFISPYVGAYGTGAEQLRFFPTLGNHDWDTASAQAYFDYFGLPGNERYYDFIWGPVHFFALNSDSREPDGVSSNSVQALWLKNQLEASTSLWKVVFMHHPPYSSGPRGPVNWMRWPLKEWGASVVLAGHDHYYERLLVGGMPYLINGLGGGPIYSFGPIADGSQVRYNADYGAILVVADSLQLTFQFINRQGEVIDTLQLTP